jgi:hypothetical protein
MLACHRGDVDRVLFFDEEEMMDEVEMRYEDEDEDEMPDGGDFEILM